MKYITSTPKKLRGCRGLKNNKLKAMDFYLVTDAGLSRKGIIHDIQRALDAGCSIIQYREKKKTTREMIGEAEKIKTLTLGKALFLVNDRVDVALASEADGVHIGQEDMPYTMARKLLGDGKIIGVTVHNVCEAMEAERIGADYVGLSPIFTTGTKKDAGTACGVSMICEIRGKIHIPIVAIGGITRENAAETILAGADSTAAISAVVSSENVYREVKEFIELIREAKRNREQR
jgi:thiamine-phosphate pyrophosphorylase